MNKDQILTQKPQNAQAIYDQLPPESRFLEPAGFEGFDYLFRSMLEICDKMAKAGFSLKADACRKRLIRVWDQTERDIQNISLALLENHGTVTDEASGEAPAPGSASTSEGSSQEPLEEDLGQEELSEEDLNAKLDEEANKLLEGI